MIYRNWNLYLSKVDYRKACNYVRREFLNFKSKQTLIDNLNPILVKFMFVYKNTTSTIKS